MRMTTRLQMPAFEYSYELIDLQQISYQTFINSHIPEEVLLAILCNFEQTGPEKVIEEIFTKLRTLQESDLKFGRSIKQLSILSLLRDLQPLIIKRIQNMALTNIDITKDYFYQQGEKRKAEQIAAKLIKEGLSNEVISRATELPESEIENLRQRKNVREKKK